MKTLNVTLAALALIATSASAALALDGPHNMATPAATYSNVYASTEAASPVAIKAIAVSSDATTRLNDAGIAAAQHH